MDKELIAFYKRELSLLYENAAAFAEEFPGIADRLGGLTGERADPRVVGLLEGTALLAARVQLKLKHEFPQFSFNLLEQLLPNYIAPTPSFMLAQISPTFGDPGLRNGRTIAKGAHFDASYPYKGKEIGCTFTLCDAITYGPFDIPHADYLPSPAAIQALGLTVGPAIAGGFRLNLRLRLSSSIENEPSENTVINDGAARLSGCNIDTLPVYLLGAEADAVALYEQLFAHLESITLRYLDSFGDPQFIRLQTSQLEQVGFGPEERLLPYEARLFRGFELLQEYINFPRKFLGFRIKGLKAALARIPARSVDILFAFTQVNPRLPVAVQSSMFALYAAPAVNLFRKTADRIPLRPNQHEYLVVPDRSQYVAYEAHRVTDVFLHAAGQEEKERVNPMFRSTLRTGTRERELFYSTRRLPRRKNSNASHNNGSARYTGTDLYLELTPPSARLTKERRPELSVVTLCSNRHMPEFLTNSKGTTPFVLRDDTSLGIIALIPPTPPREAPVAWSHEAPQRETIGQAAWRAINIMNLNHLGMGESDGRALKEVLSLFSDLSDPVMARRIRGIQGLSVRSVNRRLVQRQGVGAARGIEAKVLVEDRAFEGSGTFLLGAVLDRFFAEYVGINHFVQTVIETPERGIIARWSPRCGSRGAL
jgi:type VI secretion system protein ImpG